MAAGDGRLEQVVPKDVDLPFSEMCTSTLLRNVAENFINIFSTRDGEEIQT